MCDFCNRQDCKLTKAEVIQRGAIIESSVESTIRSSTNDTPATYFFKGVPAYNSYSALIPDEDEENPHSYTRYVFDEDTGCDGDWETSEVLNPLSWQTEKEFLARCGL